MVLDSFKRREIAKGCRYGRFLAESPVVTVGCGDQKASPRWCAIDTCIAMENLVFAATGKGLGTCWVGGFNENRVREMLKIPDHLKVVALLALGYPRQKLEKIVYFEEYEKKVCSSFMIGSNLS